MTRWELCNTIIKSSERAESFSWAFWKCSVLALPQHSPHVTVYAWHGPWIRPAAKGNAKWEVNLIERLLSAFPESDWSLTGKFTFSSKTTEEYYLNHVGQSRKFSYLRCFLLKFGEVPFLVDYFIYWLKYMYSQRIPGLSLHWNIRTSHFDLKKSLLKQSLFMWDFHFTCINRKSETGVPRGLLGRLLGSYDIIYYDLSSLCC